MIILHSVFLLALLAAPIAAQHYRTPVFPASKECSGFVVTDLDGDGDLDVAVNDAIADRTIVQHGDGQGHLAKVAELLPLNLPWGIAAGDLHGDGHVDLVVSRPDNNKLAVFSGLGGAAYGSPLQVGCPGGPRDVALSDLDGDGDLDVFTANLHDALVTVMINVGGALQFPLTYGPTFMGGEDTAAADLDLDGDIDAVIGCQGGTTMAWLPNDGAGELGTAVLLDTGSTWANTVAVADFDEDGWPDLISPPGLVAGGMPAYFSVGGGKFKGLQLLPLVVDSLFTETADVNADGHADLLVGASGGDALVLLGDGLGGFDPQGEALHLGGDYPRLHTGDMDSDGNLDLMSDGYFGPGIGVLHGDGFGHFPQPFHVPVNGNSPDGLSSTDVDLDGLPDITTANYNSNNSSVVLSHGDGTFFEKAVMEAGGGPVDTEVADVDGNGAMDVLISAFNSGVVVVYHGDGSLQFDTPTFVLDTGTGFPTGLAVGDLGAGPAGPEIVATCYVGINPGFIAILSADGVGGYLPPVQYAVGKLPNSPRLVDLEPDGDLDIVFVQLAEQTLAVLRNAGGTFGAPETWDVGVAGASPESVAVGDLDEDGRPDAVTSNNQAHSVSVFLGTPGGGFGAPAVHALGGQYPNGVALGDVDGDGHLDVVSACFGSEAFAVLLGDGAGGLGQPELYGGSASPESAVLGDYDADGELDVCVSEFPSSLAFSLTGDTDTWENLGHSLAGASGTPLLEPFGSLEAGSVVTLKLSGAAHNSVTALVLGLAQLNLPFKGGVLVPSVDVLLGGLPTGPSGALTLAGPLPAGLPSGLDLYAQHWIVDAGGPKGLAASNAAVGTTP